jgi:acetolactate synthase-1/2/3 large subunit
MWSELETVARMGIKITVLVLNNQILGYQWHAEEALYGAHTEACQLAPVDHALIANACGCVGIRVTDPAQIRPALLQSFDPLNVKTHLIDLMIDPQAYPPITLFEGRF